MADTKISALPAASTPLTGSEVVPLNQSGVTSNVTVANLTAGRNVYANNFIPSVTTTAASATPINLTVNSTQYQTVNGTTTSQQFNLPDATTLSVGDTYYFNNNLTVSSVQVNAHDGSTSVLSLQAGGDAQVVLLNNSTTNGTWDVHSFIPSSASWGTATLSFNNTTSISGSVSWTGTKIGTAYGGTGLSGSTPFTSNGVVYASSTNALATGSALQFDGAILGVNGVSVGRGAGAVATNTAVGASALAGNTSGASNTSLGYQALNSNTTASNNTAVGYQAGYTNGSGTNNTILGCKSGYSLTNGTDNALVGFQCGYAITTGTWNTCIGDNAGFGNVNLTSGTYNVMIGANTSPSAGSDNNELVIGAYSTNVTGKGSNTGFINAGGGGVYQGNNSTLWSVTSDERLKKNIVDNTVGLTAINGIKVRNFEYRLPDEITDLDKSNAVEITGVQLGPIAQELQQVLPDCVKTESTGVMSVDSSDVLWHLVTAVQQLSAQITALQAKVGV